MKKLTTNGTSLQRNEPRVIADEPMDDNEEDSEKALIVGAQGSRENSRVNTN